ncbi:hypothetical protein F4813DRAFT_55776 [Daldinia decipiens]|uniref:uncharacterized protein n=1 Tax=Daldinia decipiens TaxID=326647 RepID=UPI0020C29F02|nr:uncharacterized protein F4813DRAFT_55776 [Daldinia decipiens]KAI1658160.1 hypothetical protein F4813DRAFT_55776 [Daldinia decipiens]
MPLGNWDINSAGRSSVKLISRKSCHNLYKSNPPTDPVEDYINDTGKKLIILFNDAPKPLLDYTISHTEVTPSQLTSIIKIVAEDYTSSRVDAVEFSRNEKSHSQFTLIRS